jgi:hypothetical protein
MMPNGESFGALGVGADTVGAAVGCAIPEATGVGCGAVVALPAASAAPPRTGSAQTAAMTSSVESVAKREGMGGGYAAPLPVAFGRPFSPETDRVLPLVLWLFPASNQTAA